MHSLQADPPSSLSTIIRPWMDEAYIRTCLSNIGELELVSVKVIPNQGHGFLEFRSRAAAKQFLQSYNGTPMPNAAQNFRLEFVDLEDCLLQETFKPHYLTVEGAKVVTDRTTRDETEQIWATSEMNGALCPTRLMRVGPSATKIPSGGGQQYENAASLAEDKNIPCSDKTPHNTEEQHEYYEAYGPKPIVISVTSDSSTDGSDDDDYSLFEEQVKAIAREEEEVQTMKEVLAKCKEEEFYCYDPTIKYKPLKRYKVPQFVFSEDSSTDRSGSESNTENETIAEDEVDRSHIHG